MSGVGNCGDVGQYPHSHAAYFLSAWIGTGYYQHGGREDMRFYPVFLDGTASNGGLMRELGFCVLLEIRQGFYGKYDGLSEM